MRTPFWQWSAYTDKPVRLGGVAYNAKPNGHISGMYIKKGVIFTSRGCNNNCSFCSVPLVEGELKELPITQGNIIQDNNFLQCSREHQEKVFEMLKTQKGICFKGGLQSSLINEWFAKKAKEVKAQELWLACDTDAALKPLEKAVQILQSAGFNRNKLYCYVLIGENMEKEEQRLRQVYELGCMPFAQLYQPRARQKKIYSKEWEAFRRQWSRPAATNAHMKKGTDFRSFRT